MKEKNTEANNEKKKDITKYIKRAINTVGKKHRKQYGKPTNHKIVKYRKSHDDKTHMEIW